MRIARDDGSRLAAWWYSVDRVLLALSLLAIAGAGLLALQQASLSASPEAPAGWGLPLTRGGATLAALALVLGVSMLSMRSMRRLAGLLWLGALAASLGEIPLGGPPGLAAAAGAIVGPSAIVLVGWALAGVEERPDMPAWPMAFLVAGVSVGLAAIVGRTLEALILLAAWSAMVAGADIGRSRRVAALLTSALAAALLTAAAAGLITWPASLSPPAGSALPLAVDGAVAAVSVGTFGSVFGPADVPGHGIVAMLASLGGAVFVLRALAACGRQGPPAARTAALGLVVALSLHASASAAQWAGLVSRHTLGLAEAGEASFALPAAGLALGLLLAATRRHPRSAVPVGPRALPPRPVAGNHRSLEELRAERA
jgi:cell division protein FtsW